MKKSIGMILFVFFTGASSCKSNLTCDCTNRTVCISFVNSSGQPLESLSVLSHGLSKANIRQLPLNNKACLIFKSVGENVFSLTANLQNGKIIKSSEVYCEGGYKFTAFATKDEIKINYGNSY